jgi:hypothetical protein
VELEKVTSDRSFLSRWNAFWFTPQDPTLLGLMRILAGLITFYTIFIHGLTLDTFMSEHAWYDLEGRGEMVRDNPYVVLPLSGQLSPLPPPADQFQKHYREAYKKRWGSPPPAPDPVDKKEADFADKFRQANGYDFRTFGLPFPRTHEEEAFLAWYTTVYKGAAPPPYPKPGALEATLKILEEERKPGHKVDPRRLEQPGVAELYDNIHYRAKFFADTRLLYERGLPVWSVWFHVTDPLWMRVVQAVFVIAAGCLVLGLGTRVAAPIVWFANLCYIHRSPVILFGVDTMMNVMLLYFMIGPSGAALSIDRLLARRWWGSETRPLVSAGFVYRLLQIHLCIIYFVSGIAKLQGLSWWNGTAVWGVLANYEFAPMNSELYQTTLRWLGQNQLLFDTFITGSGYLTLIFEIGYPFLIWRPSFRRLYLLGAIFLHGFIGVFMGLKTFSLMMLVFNMAFLRAEEVHWILSRFKGRRVTPMPSTPIPTDAVQASAS